MTDSILIEGRRALTTAISGTAVKTAPLPGGQYDVWSDVDCWIRVEDINQASPNRPEDVTTANGYKVFAGNVVPVTIADGRAFGIIAGGAGNFTYHQVG